MIMAMDLAVLVRLRGKERLVCLSLDSEDFQQVTSQDGAWTLSPIPAVLLRPVAILALSNLLKADLPILPYPERGRLVAFGRNFLSFSGLPNRTDSPSPILTQESHLLDYYNLILPAIPR
jgi:hypothetical protein